MLLKSSEIRESFLKYFEEKGHLRLPSSSLVPDDPTLLLTAAGMVQFKPYFLNLAKPPATRITTCQKCVRTSDIERVGETARHLTFFEMLGNFSFGDYYKKEAIGFAVDFLFNRMKLDPDKFWVTIYEDDDEAFDIWSRDYGFPEERIVRLGKEDNFWEAGPVGPCGPCSELIIDRGEKYGCGRENCMPGCDCDRFLEVWNLVFMQYNRNEDGSLSPLPKKNIDTGMGLERISLIKQGVETVFETDLLYPLIKRIEEVSGKKYGASEDEKRSFRIIADHTKASVFLMADGVVPSNEGRGYVLRRLIRRALRYSYNLCEAETLLSEAALEVIRNFQSIYPELKENEKFVLGQLEAEEKRFASLMERGLSILEEEISRAIREGLKNLPSDLTFKLYDTYGFPVELTAEIASEKGLHVDLEDFEKLLEAHKEESRKGWKAKKFVFDKGFYHEIAERIGETEFTGYEKVEDEADLLLILKNGSEVGYLNEGEEGELILSKTPFYPEGGGQVGDTGNVEGVDGRFLFEVTDTQRPAEGVIVHIGRVVKGRAERGIRVKASVNRVKRINTERNHTATHLLHWALRLVLGEGVKQSGSFVGPDYFRFDFPYDRPLSRSELEKIENLVNRKIAEGHPVRKYETTFDYAREIGAIALFGEKYGDYVRVVESGDFSKELCGGTHVRNTSEISLFIITSERSIGSGLRRIEAITGERAIEYALSRIRSLRDVAEILSVPEESCYRAVEELKKEFENLKHLTEESKKAELRKRFSELIENAERFGNILIVKGVFENEPLKDLKELVDILRTRKSDYICAVGSRFSGKAQFYVAVSEGIASSGVSAVEAVREAAKLIKGGGGGSPSMAEAGGKDESHLGEALDLAIEIIRNKLDQS
jgi:alanyl-tRNA synthetase